MRRLLAAGLAEFGERGFQAVTVDDIVSRANASHGTFYLYFANKDDLWGVLAQEALHAMESIAGEFPVVTRNAVGRAALREWVSSFCDTYEAHAAVIRILSHADVVGRDAWQNGLKQMWRLAAVVSLGMTAGMSSQQDSGRMSAGSAHLTAVACLMMLERVNYLLSSGVQLPREEMVDRLTAIIVAAFQPAPAGEEGPAWPVGVLVDGAFAERPRGGSRTPEQQDGAGRRAGRAPVRSSPDPAGVGLRRRHVRPRGRGCGTGAS